MSILLKKIDLFVQALITGTGILLFIVEKEIRIWYALYLFTIGCWQLISAFIHLGFRYKLLIIKERNLYVFSSVAFFLILIYMLQIDLAVRFTFLVGPCLAIWYFAISFRELTIWEKRRLIQFK